MGKSSKRKQLVVGGMEVKKVFLKIVGGREPLKNLQAWGRRDNSFRKVYIPLRQYSGTLKVPKNQGE
jgi:hypothetical protein